MPDVHIYHARFPPWVERLSSLSSLLWPLFSQQCRLIPVRRTYVARLRLTPVDSNNPRDCTLVAASTPSSTLLLQSSRPSRKHMTMTMTMISGANVSCFCFHAMAIRL
jgi:hypothetical protein